MIHKIKNFVACHYLVCAYSMLALVSVLFVLFRNDWKFLVQLIVCLLVILLYAMVCGLGYIFIRAIFADKCFSLHFHHCHGTVFLEGDDIINI